ncbi:M48 family metallopeptidase [Roseibium sp. RKSG952]|uniref:M48 family metallopeptidase n=1 Tax=Roseibium sp. RKSG952 TaxID=2529384 RepID=UPI0012BC723E|nr:SprT family zinc-dependent metalloprotease [Roseibium sp. RKSG952]MTI01148.1 M48 family peptidase [Roseibium sp. RKSG952]
MLLRARKQPLPDVIRVSHRGQQFEIRVKPNNRAKNYHLRVPPDMSGPVLTVPKGGTLARAQDFAERYAGWLFERLSRRPDRVPLGPGDSVPLRGVDHVIVATGTLRGLVTTGGTGANPEIRVPGLEEHVPRKVMTWLKARAKEELTAACMHHAERVGKKVEGIAVRDTTSRWGSCSTSGRLSFSWRLILAPPEILDYVAAHEVAHLVEMNHSKRFWDLCETLAPQTPTARYWLRDHGVLLHSYG